MVDKKKKTIKKIKEEKYRSEEQQEIIRFIKILLIVVIFVLGVYLVTRLFVKKDLVNIEKETTVTKIDYNKMVFGTMLTKPYSEYYVIAFSSDDNNVNYYGSLRDKYSSNEDNLPIYYIDLSDSMNSDFVADDGKTNPNAKSVNELKVGDLTLIKVKDGKIAKYIEKVEDIKSELSIK